MELDVEPEQSSQVSVPSTISTTPQHTSHIMEHLSALLTELWTHPVILARKYPQESQISLQPLSFRGKRMRASAANALAMLTGDDGDGVSVLSSSFHVALSPNDLFQALGELWPSLFDRFRQQDAQECFRLLLDTLDREIRIHLSSALSSSQSSSSSDSGPSVLAQIQSSHFNVVKETFEGQLTSEVFCFVVLSSFSFFIPFLFFNCLGDMQRL
jgi:hypothetical protein